MIFFTFLFNKLVGKVLLFASKSLVIIELSICNLIQTGACACDKHFV